VKIRVIGAGVMGRGIAQWASSAGHAVELADVRRTAVDDAVDFIHDMLERSVRKGRISREAADATGARIVPAESPTAPGNDLDLVIEAVKADMAVKAALFEDLEKELPAQTLFATNTSSLSVTQIAAGLSDPSRLAGLHFFNPVPLMKIVEVIAGVATAPEVPDTLAAFVESCGHRAIHVADTPGFLVNHAGRALLTEAFALLEESVAGTTEIDRIARDVLGLRMGPFELMDLTGLDVTSTVMESVWQGFRHDDRLRPSYLTPNRVAAGLLGRKTGRGFYDYTEDDPGPAATRPRVGAGDRPAWVAGAGDDARALRERLRGAGAEVELGTAPSRNAVVLVTTWGTTVAEAVVSYQLPAERTVGVDPLSLGTVRTVFAVTPACLPASARDAAAVLRSEQWSFSRDTAGSVAQRLIAAMVGVAASIAERSIASPADIDAAVVAGLGYPRGPLAWADQLGGDRILELQSQLHRTIGDQRYRPTRWVMERARLGLAMTDPGTVPEAI
jgi:3-hydroxybutyryl-CoA dehydrogenase